MINYLRKGRVQDHMTVLSSDYIIFHFVPDIDPVPKPHRRPIRPIHLAVVLQCFMFPINM